MVLSRVRATRDLLLSQLYPETECPLGWDPSVFTPVFYGFRDHSLQLPPDQIVSSEIAFMSAGDSSLPTIPGTIDAECRVFYPTLDGSPVDAPALHGCARSPLIVYSHGQCEGLVPPDYHKAWFEIPATLARAGYVVLVPKYESPSIHAHDDVERMSRLVRWIRRSGSGYSDLLLPAPQTGLAGHSYGAAISALAMSGNHVAAQAFAEISGSETGAVDDSLPKLRTWGTASGDEQSAGPDDFTDHWHPPAPMNVVVFEGASHFDYVPEHRIPCGEKKHESSPLVPYLAADVVTLFFARYLPTERRELPGLLGGLLTPGVSRLLLPPHWPKTTEQAFYAGGMFSAWNSLDTGEYQRVRLYHYSGGEWDSTARG